MSVIYPSPEQKSIRPATHAGSWYSSNPTDLASQLNQFLSSVPPKTPSQDLNTSTNEPKLLDIPLPESDGIVKAIISPHAGYAYCGATAAYAYASLDPNAVDRIFLLGPSHHLAFSGCAISPFTHYTTPFGPIPLDTTIMQTLYKTHTFNTLTKSQDEAEHSLEMQLPFIHNIMSRKTNGSYTLVPILVGDLNSERLKTHIEQLKPYLDPTNPLSKGTVFILSSDFCHWGTRFRYTHLPSTMTHAPIHTGIEFLDKTGVKCLCTSVSHCDKKDFGGYLRDTGNTICGRNPILLVLEVLKSCEKIGEWRCEFLKYDQSSKCVDSGDSSVSYVAARWVWKAVGM